MSSFYIAKATQIFSAKNIRILYIESAKIVNKMTLNELVKLTRFEQLGPGIFHTSMNVNKKFLNGSYSSFRCDMMGPENVISK